MIRFMWLLEILRLEGEAGGEYHSEMPLTWKMKARYLFRDNAAWDLIWGLRERQQQKSWMKVGHSGPPHIIKQQMILKHARAFNTDILIETGTFLGDMIYAMKDQFKDIYSIELSEEFHARAKQAFKKYPHIHLVAGDSATALESVLGGVNKRCLFWLDGHYSGGMTAMADLWSPVLAEIDTIHRHPVKEHVILIDDAVCFNGENGYPTLFELHDVVVKRFPGYDMQVFDNIIQLFPAGGIVNP
jgi:hypothetical protein